jgi:hypothetical protein
MRLPPGIVCAVRGDILELTSPLERDDSTLKRIPN